jgi:hypothetical protein
MVTTALPPDASRETTVTETVAEGSVHVPPTTRLDKCRDSSYDPMFHCFTPTALTNGVDDDDPDMYASYCSNSLYCSQYVVDPELSQSVVILMVPVADRVMEASVSVVEVPEPRLAELTVAEGASQPNWTA